VLDASTSPLKERYAVSNDNVVKLIQPGALEDPLSEILRQGARTLLAQAVEAEVADFLTKHVDLKSEDGRQRIVRTAICRSARSRPGSVLLRFASRVSAIARLRPTIPTVMRLSRLPSCGSLVVVSLRQDAWDWHRM
jgi:hypothetical protein